MTNTIKVKKGRKARPHEQTCYCRSYGFPHRLNGGTCTARVRGHPWAVAKREEEEEDEDRDCGDCMGTGIGWGGPDSRCSSCRGSGMPRAARYRDEPDDREPDWRLGY
jgi:hypothetical protein